MMSGLAAEWTGCAGARLGGVLAAAVLAGCAGSGGGPKQAGTTLAPSDFQRPAAAAPDAVAARMAPAAAEAQTAPAPPPRPLKPIRMIAISEAMEGVLDVSTIPGPPPTDGVVPPETTDAAVVLDSKVGEINGRPIFASAFLEPLDGRLRAAAQRAGGDPAVWQGLALPVIERALDLEVIDELLLAEAHASIPREQKEVGLRAFMKEFREDLARHNQGSIAAADDRLQREEGLSIDQKTRQEMEKQLILTHLRQRIAPRIQVSARDQRDYYERYFSEFNPPGEARLRVIRVPEGEESDVEAITAALAAGTPFAEAAALEANRHKPDAGGLRTVTVEGPYEEADLLSLPELNEAARGLHEGEHAGPIRAQGSVWWVMLEGVDRPESQSFYEAQLEINRRLLNERSELEQARYLTQLRAQGSYSNLQETAQRLFDIATARYFGR